MTIHLYTLCWNEADILPFFFRHFDPVVDRYVVADDGSTDGSLDILMAHPKVEVRRFQRVIADSFVLSQQHFQNEAWRESRGTADWVIITALDEHLTVRGGLGPYLDRYRGEGVTLIPALGYQMVSEDFPAADETLVRTRTQGAPYHRMNKLAIFDPAAITDTGFQPGRHASRPKGRLVYPRRNELMLWHYKLMGKQRMLDRQRAQSKGLGPGDAAKGFGAHYTVADAEMLTVWDSFEERLIDLGDPAFDPALPGNYEGPLWWRKSRASRLWRWLRRR
ncbi:glycosyltransferase family 2 protein [Tabrizicola sp. BL-A-41-H6]|uniref:glycosyltransferase family 2 protein n=1 Tax=Tabrizicola sp. BL-A-41-H6 TaxID=3421107 RepID=UPI003D67D13F